MNSYNFIGTYLYKVFRTKRKYIPTMLGVTGYFTLILLIQGYYTNRLCRGYPAKASQKITRNSSQAGRSRKSIPAGRLKPRAEDGKIKFVLPSMVVAVKREQWSSISINFVYRESVAVNTQPAGRIICQLNSKMRKCSGYSASSRTPLVQYSRNLQVKFVTSGIHTPSDKPSRIY